MLKLPKTVEGRRLIFDLFAAGSQFQLQCVVWYMGRSITVVMQTANHATKEFTATLGNTNIAIFLPITNGLLGL